MTTQISTDLSVGSVVSGIQIRICEVKMLTSRGFEGGVVENILASESVLITSILTYARKGEFTKYTSTLEEAWRLSINELSKVVCENVTRPLAELEMQVEETYTDDPMAAFGITEAERHRSRGTPLRMFLALYKYYLQSYLDLVDQFELTQDQLRTTRLKITRIFDRIELAYLHRWISTGDEDLLAELQERNRFLTNEKNKFLTIMESLNIPMVYINPELEVQHINSAGNMFIKRTHQKESWYYLEDRDDLQIPGWLLNRIQELGNSDDTEVVFEQTVTTKDELYYYSIHIAKMQDVSNKFAGYSVLGQDITTRKKAENAIAESNNLRELLLDIITHDLKNPASVILGLSDLARAKLPDNEIIEGIYSNSIRLLEVLDHTTTLSQATFGEQISITSLSLNTIIKNVSEDFSAQLHEKEMTLEVHIPEDMTINANPLISEVLKNYISNAIKYASGGRAILVEAISENDSVLIAVKDFGVTIPENNRERVFERHVQLETGKKRGRGLGLAIVKRIATAHGGSAWVEPNLPCGNAFFIKIPRFQNPEAEN